MNLKIKMDIKHRETLASDYEEVFSFRKKTIIQAKNLVYLFTRIFFDRLFRLRGYSELAKKEGLGDVDLLLRDDGGMFKSIVYKQCDSLASLRGKDVLVPGVGYGRNLFQLATFGPRKIVGFDLYDYPEEWAYMTKELKDKFGVEVVFLRGGFEALASFEDNSFDWIISDAVLEHVADMDDFMRNSRRLLKNSGIFYASFGPIWFGVSGDHMNWGAGRAYDHILAPEKEYNKNIEEKSMLDQGDSIEGVFLVKNKIFSYLSLKEYFKSFSNSGFIKKITFLKMSSIGIKESGKSSISKLLDKHSVPKLDRLASGAYIWMENKK